MFAYTINKDLKLVLPNPERDAKQLFELVDNSRKSMQVWLPWVANLKTVDDEIKFLKHVNVNFGTGESLNVAIYQKQQPVGMISFNHIKRNNMSTDIGYWLAESARGQGIMHQAVLAMVKIGFEDYGLNRLEIEAAVGNHESNHVAQKAGFKLEGTLREDILLLDGRYHDHNLYSLLRKEWQDK
ncbi:Ribosomal-protein-L7p-serine acetyltransferase [Pediococcus damnosus]|uniref:Ribosomal-protein-L7p-serine acetyltransferase n=1 Tax=Pediococcus damnosus TaxID=51663 RepID=A0A0R2HKX3_9LACO|nr:GNAT family protein [Pediococcus damnosus]AMV63111.1 Ribosomal-protein-L7p-serine acetyltransferase [Pediococcus damnosus]AMV64743.1 Ribosomal-protein-L7p-serine acetyltransferase [Pediococcus damnosus]AMV66997.1 Ribosomal-protein-L7p-serine acetyltransferase [Pediococcus damnosus]AMV69403.1 Ribosomal-protein-L7p-serine acetyltransferase [Pediococcus damnosus]KJU73488.1 acetyltransferase [Pediococcus damnosus LMG 28219]